MILKYMNLNFYNKLVLVEFFEVRTPLSCSGSVKFNKEVRSKEDDEAIKR